MEIVYPKFKNHKSNEGLNTGGLGFFQWENFFDYLFRETKSVKRVDTRRDARTHALCFKAGHLEYVFPVIKDSGKTEFVQFINGLAALPIVKEYAAYFVYHPIEEVEG